MNLIRLTFCFAACAAACLCQGPPAAAQSQPQSLEPQVGPYESFFRTVEQRSRMAVAPPPGVDLAEPATVQEALGLTDQELLALNTIAVDCEARLSAARRPAAQGIFQARLDAIESGKDSPKLTQQQKEMETQVAQAIEQSLRQLKSALGDAHFQKLDDWVRSGGPKSCWLSPCTSAVRR